MVIIQVLHRKITKLFFIIIYFHIECYEN